MYDFFAFALPGSCVIISFFLLFINNSFIYHSAVPLDLKESLPHFFIVLAITGYIVGYTITPLGRAILKQFLNLKIDSSKKFEKKSLSIDKLQKQIYFKLAKQRIFSISLSKFFIHMRESTRTSSQYIEFWDMHSKMSSNFFIASLVFLIIQNINHFLIPEDYNSCSAFDDFLISLFLNPCWIMISSIILLLILWSLMETSVRYAIWWSEDIDEASKFCKENKSKNNH